MKIIKVGSCKFCNHIGSFNWCHKFKIDVGMDKLNETIHSECKLEDYNQCDCEPFQSCEKCKTEWLPLSAMSGIGKDYWIRDKKDVIGVGYLADAHRISFDFAKTPHDFGTPILCAEIKPPRI